MATVVHWIETPKPQLSAEQRAALAAAFYRSPRDWRKARNRAIALLVLSEGMRPAEVAALRIDEARAWRQAGAEGAAVRRRSRLARQALNEWLALRTHERIPGDQAFPRDERGAVYRPSDVYRLIHRVLRRAGVDPRQLGRISVRDCVRRTSFDGVRRARALPRPAGDPPPRLRAVS
jgi:integrase